MTSKTIDVLLRKHVADKAHSKFDQSILYEKLGQRLAPHSRVNRSNEGYSYYNYQFNQTVAANTFERFFGNTNLSINRTHHLASSKHRPPYIAELDYKYNSRELSDGGRASTGIPKIVRKRLIIRLSKRAS